MSLALLRENDIVRMKPQRTSHIFQKSNNFCLFESSQTIINMDYAIDLAIMERHLSRCEYILIVS